MTLRGLCAAAAVFLLAVLACSMPSWADAQALAVVGPINPDKHVVRTSLETTCMAMPRVAFLLGTPWSPLPRQCGAWVPVAPIRFNKHRIGSMGPQVA